MGILQDGIEIIDPRASFSQLDGLEVAGQTFPKPEDVCYIPPHIPVPLLMTNLGLKVADINCLYCAHSRGECPISALSHEGRKKVKPIFHGQLNLVRRKEEKWYAFPGLIRILSDILETPILLPPELREGIVDYAQPYMFLRENVNNDHLAEV